VLSKSNVVVQLLCTPRIVSSNFAIFTMEKAHELVTVTSTL